MSRSIIIALLFIGAGVMEARDSRKTKFERPQPILVFPTPRKPKLPPKPTPLPVPLPTPKPKPPGT